MVQETEGGFTVLEVGGAVPEVIAQRLNRDQAATVRDYLNDVAHLIDKYDRAECNPAPALTDRKEQDADRRPPSGSDFPDAA
jgi:hypothetical protein